MSSSRPYLAADARMQNLLEAAGRVFEARGIRELSVAEVAKEAGVSRALAYGFFPDRGSLQLAFFGQRVQTYQSFPEVTSNADLPPVERVMQLFELFCDLPSSDLYALNAIMYARANDELVPVRLKWQEMLRERWQGVLDFENGPPGLFPAVWLFCGMTLSMALDVNEGRMVREGARTLLRVLITAAVAQVPPR